MKITIIGAGAMGSLFGSLLAQSGQNVLLIDIWQDHIDTINSQGLGVESDGKINNIDIKASNNIQDGQGSDLVIIFVKSTQTQQAAADAQKCLNDKGKVLTLQNGMGNADIISQIINPEKVIAGTTSHGATILGPGLIRHAGIGPTLIGMWSNQGNTDLEDIQNIFNNAGIDTKIENNIHLIVWKKLIINVGINAITALTGIKNGKIVDHPPTGELVRAAVTEACDVALAHGVKLPDDIAEQVFTVAEATGPNRSSMGQDVDHQRPTEIDAINGAVVHLAKDKKIAVPVNKTLTALIKTMQDNYK
ncbi:MAG: 2-dehydropantoate 2-reductase [Desulfobacteraceae bacterium]|nr:2-dehydropantoate 2-reductase [Desulfobacteraceae bacterium]